MLDRHSLFSWLKEILGIHYKEPSIGKYKQTDRGDWILWETQCEDVLFGFLGAKSPFTLIASGSFWHMGLEVETIEDLKMSFFLDFYYKEVLNYDIATVVKIKLGVYGEPFIS